MWTNNKLLREPSFSADHRDRLESGTSFQASPICLLKTAGKGASVFPGVGFKQKLWFWSLFVRLTEFICEGTETRKKTVV